MPIVARPPGVGTPPLPGGSHSGDDPSVGANPAAPGALLPTGAPIPVAPALTPARALASDALRALRWLREPSRAADPGDDARLCREVDAVRRHLAPLRTRASLARSYAREAFHGTADAARDVPGAVRLAYAVRWLELGPRDGHAAARPAALVTSSGPSARSGRSGRRVRRWRPSIRPVGPSAC